MKKVLCNKDGKFLSIHDGDCTLTELNDGDCLTHEDGTIVIYKEGDSEPLLENIYFHAYYKNGSLYLPKKTFSFYDYVSCGYKFSTKEEKKRMNEVLSENNLYYDEKEKCTKKLHWRAKMGDSYYYIDWNRFTICKTVEADSESDNIRYKNLNYFQTKEEAENKLDSIKNILND